MTPPNALTLLLEACRQRGIVLRHTEDGQLRVQAPPGALDDELRQGLRHHRAALLALLEAPAALPAPGDGHPRALSPAQQGIWALHHHDGPRGAVCLTGLFTLPAGVDRQRLAAAVAALPARHSALRLQFHQDDTGQPGQSLAASVRLDLEQQPLPSLDPQHPALALFNQALTDTAFSLDQAPLLRMVWLDTPEGAALALAAHHLIVDGWSLGLLLADLQQLYANPQAPAAAEPDLLAELDRPLPDAGQTLCAWRDELQGAPLTHALALHACPRQPHDHGVEAARLQLHWPASTHQALAALSNSWLGLLLAITRLAFARLGDTDLVLSTPVSQRADRAALAELVGPFADLAVTRLRLEAPLHAGQLLTRTAAEVAQLRQRSTLGLTPLLELLVPPRMEGVNPLSQVFVAWQDGVALHGTGQGTLPLTPLMPPEPPSQYDLMLEWHPLDAGGLGCELRYHPRHVAADAATRLHAALQAAVTALVHQHPLDAWLPAPAAEDVEARRLQAHLLEWPGVEAATVLRHRDELRAYILAPAGRVHGTEPDRLSSLVPTPVSVQRVTHFPAYHRDLLWLPRHDSRHLAALLPHCQQPERAAALLARTPSPAPARHRELLLPGGGALCWRTPRNSAQLSWTTGTAGTGQSLVEGPPLAFTDDQRPPFHLLTDHVARVPCFSFIDARGVLHHEDSRLFLQHSLQVAARLRQAGLAAGDTVMLYLDDLSLYLKTWWATLHLGLAVVPVLPPRQQHADDPAVVRVRHMSQLLGEPLLLHDPLQSAGQLLPASVPRLALQQPQEGDPACTAGQAFDWPRDQVAIITFTSGSTGLPKAVPLSIGALLTETRLMDQAFGPAQPGDVTLNMMPLDHVASLISHYLTGIRRGVRQIAADVQAMVGQPERLLQVLAAEQVSHTWAPDFLIRLLAEAAPRCQLPGQAPLASLRSFISAGECTRRGTFDSARRTLGPLGLPAGALRNSWGMSETCSLLTLSDGDGTGIVHEYQGVIDAGRPLPGCVLRLTGADGQVVPQGCLGRFEVAGATVFNGYLDHPQANAESFPPSADGRHWLRTGDLAILRDDRVIFVGREKEILILNGQNVSQVEIEAVVERVAGVEPVCTAAVSSRDTLRDRDDLILFYVSHCTDEHSLRQQIQGIRHTVARHFGTQPRHVLPVPAHAIGKTGLGKIQRTALRKTFEQGAFDPLVRHIDELTASPETLPVTPLNWILVPEPAPAGAPPGVHWQSLSTPPGDAPRDGAIGVLDTLALSDQQPQQGADLLAAAQALAVTLAQVCPPGSPPRQLTFFCRHGVTAAGIHTDPLACALVALAAGLNATQSGLVVRVIDLVDGAADPARLTPLLALAGRQPRRLDAAGQLWQRRLHPCPWVPARLEEPGLLVVAGGLGQVGRALLPELIHHWQGDLLVIGRRPPAEADAVLAPVRSANERVRSLHYLSLDVTDPHAVLRSVQALAGQIGTAVQQVWDLTGPVPRDSRSTATSTALAQLLAERRAVQTSLGALLPATGTLVCAGSSIATFGSQDYLLYGMLAGWVEGRALARQSGPRQITLAFSQWHGERWDAGVFDALERQGFHTWHGSDGFAALLAGSWQRTPWLLLGVRTDSNLTGPMRADPAQAADQLALLRKPGTAALGAAWSGPALLEPEHATLPRLEDGRFDAEHSDTPPAPGGLTDTERALLLQWRQALGRPAVSLHGNFFDQGGSSLAANRAVALASSAFALPLAPLDLFSHPTVALFAAFIDQQRQSSGSLADATAGQEAARRATRQRQARRQRRSLTQEP